MAKRIYKTKGDNACSRKVTVPITPATDDRLRAQAAVRNQTHTEFARQLLMVGLLDAEMQQP